LKQTGNLIKLARPLVIVSAALAFFALVQTAIMLIQDANTHVHQIQAGKHQKGTISQK
jgi:hypothetical protein